MTGVSDANLQQTVRSAIAIDGVESAVVFVVRTGSPRLDLAAAGVEGLALDGLVAAVGNPGHPINRTVVDGVATFDVQPTAPGGPPLRSHLPLVAGKDGRRTVAGVLAIAHRHGLDSEARQELEGLADMAAATVAATHEAVPD
jgi:hypothetical protein